jgi:hypothetical protein
MPFATAISFGLLRLIIATQESGWDWLPHSSLTSTKTIIPCYLLVPCNSSLSLTVILYMQLEFFFNIDARTWLSLEALELACGTQGWNPASSLLSLPLGYAAGVLNRTAALKNKNSSNNLLIHI